MGSGASRDTSSSSITQGAHLLSPKLMAPRIGTETRNPLFPNCLYSAFGTSTGEAMLEDRNRTLLREGLNAIRFSRDNGWVHNEVKDRECFCKETRLLDAFEMETTKPDESKVIVRFIL